MEKASKLTGLQNKLASWKPEVLAYIGWRTSEGSSHGIWKRFRTWKVRGSVGQEGWFIEENDSIKFKNYGK
ncbi:MAG: hypothetical protein GJV46_11900 [Geobacter sp.]|nr:hypothetical protein [Geobacter sp.]